MGVIHYFAYGYHIDPETLSHLNIQFESCSPALLSGYQLVFNVLEDELFLFEKYGLPNIVPNAQTFVEGLMYSIEEVGLPLLDKASGVDTLKYYRKKIKIKLLNGSRNGSPIEAVTYVGWPDVTAKGLQPNVKYLQKLVEAACRQGISSSFCRWLEKHPCIF